MTKYVIKFMPEYCATCLWSVNDAAHNDFGYPIMYEDLKLSNPLIERLEKFDDGVMDILNWKEPNGPLNLTYEEQMELYKEGCELLKLVTVELGDDYEIINDVDWIKPDKDNMMGS